MEQTVWKREIYGDHVYNLFCNKHIYVAPLERCFNFDGDDVEHVDGSEFRFKGKIDGKDGIEMLPLCAKYFDKQWFVSCNCCTGHVVKNDKYHSAAVKEHASGEKEVVTRYIDACENCKKFHNLWARWTNTYCKKKTSL